MAGLEPATAGWKRRISAAELHARQGGFLVASWRRMRLELLVGVGDRVAEDESAVLGAHIVEIDGHGAKPGSVGKGVSGR